MYWNIFDEIYFLHRKMGIVTANLMFVGIPVTLVKLVIMLLIKRITLVAKVR